jgi:muramoyltetrapeptide carboxypeptidase LdcA involved in peptidoglycan recycling
MSSPIRFPRPLRPGDRVAVTAPSAGVEGPSAARIDFCLDWLRGRGYDVVVGECLHGSGLTSAPAEQRAAELTRMLADPEIHCVVPPWGGETAIDMVDLLDWDALADAEPTWLVGYSDLSTLLVPITTRLGCATLHGDNLADTPYAVPDGLLHWLDLAGGPGPFVQRDSGLVAEWVRFEQDPRATEWGHVGKGRWEVQGGGSLDVSGRLIGGCIETVANLAGTPYGDVRAWAEALDEHPGVERVGVQGGHVLEHLHGAYAAPGAPALQHDTDPGEQLGAVALGVAAQHPHGAALRDPVTLAGLERCRLAGAVGAEHGGDRSPRDLERQPVDGHLVAVRHHQAVDDAGGGGRWHVLILGAAY